MLLLLQKNWLCASQDDSLLPPTALAERNMGEHKMSIETKLCSLCSALFSIAAFLSVLQLLHSSLQLIKKTSHRLPAVDLCSLWTTWTRHYNHCGNIKMLIAWAETMTTTLNLHATTLQFAWTTLLHSVVKKRQRPWHHLRTSLFLEGWNAD